MKIELKNVKYSPSLSQETNAFTADVWVDGKKEGEARNDGHGGMTFVHPAALSQKLSTYTATLPNVVYFGESLPMTGDLLIDTLLDQHLRVKDLQKLLKAQIVFTKANEQGIFNLKKMPAAQTQSWLQHPELKTKIKADKILNLLPFDEAMVIFNEALATM